MKGMKTGGRPPGGLNKTTVEVKTMVEQAITEVGGIAALVRWAKKNPDLFWTKIVSKLIPRDIPITGPGGGPVQIQVLVGVPPSVHAEAPNPQCLPK